MARTAYTAEGSWTLADKTSDAPTDRARLEAEAAALAIEWGRSTLQLSVEEMARMLEVSDRTVKRWLQHQSGPAPEQRARLRKLHNLRYLTEAVFASITAARKWYHTPLRTLRGHSPVDAMTDGQMDDVIGLLAGIESGSHA